MEKNESQKVLVTYKLSNQELKVNRNTMFMKHKNVVDTVDFGIV